MGSVGEERLRTGKGGEDAAVDHLVGLGYRIVERNYRCPLGEIDVIARDGESLVFVEVKSRRSGRYGGPRLAVGTKKQQKLSLLAQFYLKQKRLYGCRARFDVVAVTVMSDGENRVEIIKNAFDLCYGW